MNPLSQLAEVFADFPGIGPRQAKRFVYFLLTKDPTYTDKLIRLVGQIKESVRVCQSCFRFFNSDHPIETCSICRDKNRDTSLLAVVSHDVDLDQIEKSHSYKGLYFVLGGTVPILEKEPEKKIRARELVNVVSDRIKTGVLKEIILAMSSNVEGEHTADIVKHFLTPITETAGVKISTLGRGLSTGTELEYSDTETLKNALGNRK